ncbi:hypothetical protein TL16_g00610 [Triparma laevis f. inornata]|uniref:Chitin-binding type-4 domain-containing protein n=2 Tax=Triparma laevis TaxID=1534972 RepID=A0A9W7KYP8_9STRA|nr:hypothetical protein TL16_g00610 [Triparma laevis f. inornata]GMI16279.1 hypothetical protein TrLO_g11936 [Triparma laevis f. longispina]
MKFYLSLTLSLPATLVHSHGIFWSPENRATISEQSGYMEDATTIISEPMPDVGEPGRNYPGNRPFAEPGTSLSVVGPCGMESYDDLKTNYNHPEHGWGEKVSATYKPAEIIDVEWCVSNIADHGGLYSYRICTDDSIVAPFIEPDHTPNDSEMAALETCFQAGQLRCDDVPGQECPVHPDCVGTDWGCASAKSWFACGPKDDGRCMSAPSATGESCKTHGADGTILRDQVKLPDFTSNHTLLGFRWDCEDTGQLWLHCADIAIV